MLRLGGQSKLGLYILFQFLTEYKNIPHFLFNFNIVHAEYINTVDNFLTIDQSTSPLRQSYSTGPVY